MRLRHHRWIMRLYKFWSLRASLAAIRSRGQMTRRPGMDYVFYDLGAADGDTAEVAVQAFPWLERLVLFEPLKAHVQALNGKYAGSSRVEVVDAAAGTQDVTEVKLYRGTTFGALGNSTLEGKKNVDAGNYESVRMLDFARFLSANLPEGSVAVLKIDVEGSEYELLDALDRADAWGRVAKVYCEWHWDRIGRSSEEHLRSVRMMQRAGYDLVGINRFDEFTQQMTNGTYWRVGMPA